MPQTVSALLPQWEQAQDITALCGPIQIQAVLKRAGHDVPLEDLYVSRWARRDDRCLPWHVGYLLDDYKIASRMHALIGARTFASVVRSAIDRDRPVILLMNATSGKHGLHWISLWGYSDRDAFAAYDSQYPSRVGGAGNKRYDASLLATRFPILGRTYLIEVGD